MKPKPLVGGGYAIWKKEVMENEKKVVEKNKEKNKDTDGIMKHLATLWKNLEEKKPFIDEADKINKQYKADIEVWYEAHPQDKPEKQAKKVKEERQPKKEKKISKELEKEMNEKKEKSTKKIKEKKDKKDKKDKKVKV